MELLKISLIFLLVVFQTSFASWLDKLNYKNDLSIYDSDDISDKNEFSIDNDPDSQIYDGENLPDLNERVLGQAVGWVHRSDMNNVNKLLDECQASLRLRSWLNELNFNSDDNDRDTENLNGEKLLNLSGRVKGSVNKKAEYQCIERINKKIETKKLFKNDNNEYIYYPETIKHKSCDKLNISNGFYNYKVLSHKCNTAKQERITIFRKRKYDSGTCWERIDLQTADKDPLHVGCIE